MWLGIEKYIGKLANVYILIFSISTLNHWIQSPIQELEEEKKEHAARLLKMEKEMEEVFERKVREKQRKLTDTESDLKQKLSEAQEKLDKQKEELDDKIASFERVRNLHFLYFSVKKKHFCWFNMDILIT